MFDYDIRSRSIDDPCVLVAGNPAVARVDCFRDKRSATRRSLVITNSQPSAVATTFDVFASEVRRLLQSEILTLSVELNSLFNVAGWEASVKNGGFPRQWITEFPNLHFDRIHRDINEVVRRIKRSLLMVTQLDHSSGDSLHYFVKPDKIDSLYARGFMCNNSVSQLKKMGYF